MSTTTPQPSSRKNRTPTHSGDCFGLGFGGGCRGLLLDRLFGISRIVVEGGPPADPPRRALPTLLVEALQSGAPTMRPPSQRSPFARFPPCSVQFSPSLDDQRRKRGALR